MLFEQTTLDALEPRTKKLLLKVNKRDAFVDDYLYYIGSIHEQLKTLAADDFYFSYNVEYRYYWRKYKAVNRILRYHLKHYTRKFPFSMG